MNSHYLIVVPTPDCYRYSSTTFVIGEFLLSGWLKGVAAIGPRFNLTDDVTAEVAGRFADALEQMEMTPKDELHDGLCGNPGGGRDAFCAFLRGGGFQLVDGRTVKPEDLE